MPLTSERRAPKGDAPRRVQVAAKRSEHSFIGRPPQHRRPPATSRVMASITAALADIDPADRPQLLRWIPSRGLLGLAHETGFADAAGLAYRYADMLAGGVR